MSMIGKPSAVIPPVIPARALKKLKRSQKYLYRMYSAARLLATGSTKPEVHPTSFGQSRELYCYFLSGYCALMEIVEMRQVEEIRPKSFELWHLSRHKSHTDLENGQSLAEVAAVMASRKGGAA